MCAIHPMAETYVSYALVEAYLRNILQYWVVLRWDGEDTAFVDMLWSAWTVLAAIIAWPPQSLLPPRR